MSSNRSNGKESNFWSRLKRGANKVDDFIGDARETVRTIEDGANEILDRGLFPVARELIDKRRSRSRSTDGRRQETENPNDYYRREEDGRRGRFVPYANSGSPSGYTGGGGNVGYDDSFNQGNEQRRFRSPATTPQYDQTDWLRTGDQSTGRRASSRGVRTDAPGNQPCCSRCDSCAVTLLRAARPAQYDPTNGSLVRGATEAVYRCNAHWDSTYPGMLS